MTEGQQHELNKLLLRYGRGRYFHGQPYYKWRILRRARLPEPPLPHNLDYAPREGSRLIDQFRDSGLQIIVKLASIELKPEKPDFPAGGWQVEGQMNEDICGTALYYLDSENITANNLSFRMQTSTN